MNEIVNNFSLAGDKLMPEMNLIQPRYTYSDYGPFTKNKGGVKKFKNTGNWQYINQSELDKACFQHDMVYGTARKMKFANKNSSSKCGQSRSFLRHNHCR